jgi:hypothetical protein
MKKPDGVEEEVGRRGRRGRRRRDRTDDVTIPLKQPLRELANADA